jgi:hypothetical protein
MAITIPSPIPVPNGTYSETGFFYLTNSYQTDCTAPFLSYGIPVDRCIIDDGFAYKFQLVEGRYFYRHGFSPRHN